MLLDRAAIDGHVRRLGREIADDHPDGVVLVGVLKGALIFLADLAAPIPDVDVVIDFISISRFAPDSGRVKILHDLDGDIGGRDVVLVEDIVDTGLTLAYLVGQLSARGPRRLSTCAMLDRPLRRIVPQERRLPGSRARRRVRARVRTARPRPVPERSVRSRGRPRHARDPARRVRGRPVPAPGFGSGPGGRVTIVPTEEP